MGLIFGYDYNGKNIEWTWNVRPKDKVLWKTWKPKKENIKLLTPLTSKEENDKLIAEIFEGIMETEHPKKKKLTGIYKARKLWTNI